MPGWWSDPAVRPARAATLRAQQANGQAFLQILVVTVIFVAVLVLALVTSSAALQALLLLFS